MSRQKGPRLVSVPTRDPPHVIPATRDPPTRDPPTRDPPTRDPPCFPLHVYNHRASPGIFFQFSSNSLPILFQICQTLADKERLEAELMRLQSEASHASHSASRLQQKLLADFGKTKYTWRMAHFSHMSDPVVATSQDLIPPQKAASLKTTTLRSRGSIARSVGSPLGGKKKERTSFTSFRSFRDLF